MTAKLIKRKTILITILSLTIVALVLGLTVPAMAAGPTSRIPRGGINSNVTVVQGTIAALGSTSILIKTTGSNSTTVTLTLNSNTGFNIGGNGWFTPASLLGDNVTAIYSNNQTVSPPVASQVNINMPTATPFTINNPPNNNNFAKVQGNITVNSGNTITVTPAGGSAVGPLTLNANTVVILDNATLAASGSTVNASTTLNGAASVNYNSANNTVNQLIINGSTATPTTGNSPGKNNNFARVQGTLTVNTNGTITVKPATGSSVGPLTLGPTATISLEGVTLAQTDTTFTAIVTPSGSASVSYDSKTDVASQVTLNIPMPPMGTGNHPVSHPGIRGFAKNFK